MVVATIPKSNVKPLCETDPELARVPAPAPAQASPDSDDDNARQPGPVRVCLPIREGVLAALNTLLDRAVERTPTRVCVQGSPLTLLGLAAETNGRIWFSHRRDGLEVVFGSVPGAPGGVLYGLW